MSGESSMAEMVGVPASVLFWLAIVWGILLGIDFFSQRILLTVARLRAQWRDPRLGLIEAARRASGRRHMLVFGDVAVDARRLADVTLVLTPEAAAAWKGAGMAPQNALLVPAAQVPEVAWFMEHLDKKGA